MSDHVVPGSLTALATGKKPAFRLTLPDGRILEIDAPDRDSAEAAKKEFLDREAAQRRLAAEDAQRGPFGRLFKNISDGTTQLAANIPLVGGLVDEGNALVRSGGGLWSDYDQELAYERERQAQAAERSPTASTINSVAGAVGGGGAMVKALPIGAAAFIPKTATARIMAGGVTGAAGGAVEGFTRGEGSVEKRLANMPPSMAMGGIVGTGFPALAKGIGAGYNAVAAWAANRGLDAKSINILLDQLKAQGVSAQQARERIAELGDKAMLADVTPGMQAFNGGTARADFDAGNMIGQRLAQRREGGGDQGRDTLDAAFGPPTDPYTVGSGGRGNTLRNQRAFEEGRKDVLKEGPDTMTQAQLAAKIAQSSASENANRAQGMRTYIERNMDNARANPDVRVDRVMERDWNTEKITNTIGSEKAQNLRRGLDADATSTETSNLGEIARQRGSAAIGAARDFWSVNGKPGTVSDMLAAALGASTSSGSLSAGAMAAMGLGANRLRHAASAARARKAQSALIQKTADNLTAQGGDLRAIARMLVDKAEELPKRSERARNIERIARHFLATQAGRVGYETQSEGAH